MYYEKCLQIDKKTNNNERLILVLNKWDKIEHKQLKLDEIKLKLSQSFSQIKEIKN